MLRRIERFFSNFDSEEFCFKCIGVDLAAADHEPFLRHPVRFAVSFSASVFCAIAVVKFAAKFHSNVDLLVEALTLLMLFLLSTTKYLAFHPNARRFIKLAKALINLARNVNAEEQAIWNATMTRKKRTNAILFLLGWLCCLQYMMTPLFLLVHRYHKTGEIVSFALIPGILPYNDQHPANCALTFIMEFLFVSHSISTLLAIDGQYYNFAQQVSAHFQIICAKIQSLGDASAPDLKQRLSLLIAYHSVVLDLANQLNSIYSHAILSEVVLSTFTLCSAIYRFTYARNLENVIFLLLLVLSVSTELSLYCFGGEKVQNESENVSDAIYLHIRWDEIPPRMRTLLLPTIIRSQRSNYMSGFFFMANRKLLVWVFRMAISLSAVLLALKDE